MPTEPNPLPSPLHSDKHKNTRQPPCRRVFCRFICLFNVFTPFNIKKYTFFRLF